MKKVLNFLRPQNTNCPKSPTLFAGSSRASQVQFLWQARIPNALSAFAMLFIAFLLPTQSNAQLPCHNVTTACLDHPSEPTTYKCITGPISISALLNDPDPNISTLLLPQAQAANTAQRIVIKGTLIVDISTSSGGYTFFTDSEIVFADQLSEIVITNGNSLKLNKTSVHGCSDMWKRISAQPGATLIVENQCQIRDGYTSIEALKNSKISITNNFFDRNLLAVYLGSTNYNVQEPLSFSPGGGIWGNTFSGLEGLKAPFVGSRPTNGMLIAGVDNINIGSWAGGQNLFTSFENFPPYAVDCRGISISNSDVTVRNSRFEFIAFNSTQQDDGATGAVQGSTVAVQGLGAGENSTSTFLSCKSGVYLSNSSTDVSNAKFSTVNECIVHIQNLGNSPRYVKATNCRFKGFLRNGIIAKREAANAINLSAFEVQNCVFDDDIHLLGVRTAVRVSSEAAASGETVKINNNKLYFRDRSSFNPTLVMIGFEITNLFKGVGENNEFYDEWDEGLAEAIKMQGCNGFRWANNDIIGINSEGQPDQSFIINESPNCIYNCNYLSGMGIGMNFSGMCGASSLYQNSFNNHFSKGLYLNVEGTVIGGQFKKYNTWGGNPGDTEAFMYFPNYNPIFDADKVKKSQFIIQTSNQNSGYWANPRIVGVSSGGGNDPNWFVAPITPTPPTVNLCPAETLNGDDPKLDYGEKGIVDGTFTPWKGYAANTWDAAFLLYQRMTEDASLRPQGSIEATWYASNYPSNLGKLHRVFDGFVSLTSDAPTATTTQLYSDLNATVVNTTYEQNLKTVLRIFLELQISGGGSPLTPQQILDLTYIADQCRYEGGSGVVMARLALGQSSQRVGDCPSNLGRGESGDRSDQESPHLVNATVFPNPAEQAFSLQLDRSLQNATVHLVDLQGRILGNWKFSGDVLNVREANVSAGVYLLEVLEQGHVLTRSKIVFNH